MGRAHWQDAARYLLEGVLRHQDDANMPIRMPGDSPGASVNLEALSRTFMLAAPLLAENPDEEVAGLRLRDYYAGQILLALDPTSRWYVGDPLEIARKRGRPTGTVDGAAIALGLWMAGPQLWDSFADAEQAVVGSWLHAVAHGRTNSHNFRWFNVTMASFLATKGWEIDTVMVEDHLQNLLAYYAGDGWYRDAGNFDFYSSWAFQFYAPVWCAMYGNEHMPEAAALLAANHNDLMCTYPALFGRDGTMPMWGRSICYRSAATVLLASAFLLNEPSVDPGWARRICSGSLLQFLTRDDVFTDGVATLGFTRAFPPVVQSYSGTASPYWWSKLFLALCLPEDSPFWTAMENEGGWESPGR